MKTIVITLMLAIAVFTVQGQDRLLVCTHSTSITTYAGTEMGGVSFRTSFALVSQVDDLQLNLAEPRSPLYKELLLQKGEMLIVTYNRHRSYRGIEVAVENYRTPPPTYRKEGNVKHLTFYINDSYPEIAELLVIEEEIGKDLESISAVAGSFHYRWKEKEHRLLVRKFDETFERAMP
jgi:hypothetical protein